MPLTQCRECGAQVSTEAHSCPHCGVPSPTSPSDSLRQGSEPERSTFSRRPTAPQRQRLEPQPAAERHAVSATTGRARKYCQHCGNDIDAKAEVCPHCGVRAKSSALGQPGIAAVLSLLWVGLGQIYNGEVLKGILFMVFSGVLFLTVFFYVGFFLLPAFWVYNIYDAYSTAVKSSSTPSGPSRI
jgi:TM2 domain-containing membrane protein YozV/RNA polymerase subunit RPABC4/transcription elongation factor Spt4